MLLISAERPRTEQLSSQITPEVLLTFSHKAFTSFSANVSPFRNRSICSSNSVEAEAILLGFDIVALGASSSSRSECRWNDGAVGFGTNDCGAPEDRTGQDGVSVLCRVLRAANLYALLPPPCLPAG